MDSIIKMVLDGNWVDLGKHVEARAADKIQAKVAEKKNAFVAGLNAEYGSEEE